MGRTQGRIVADRTGRVCYSYEIMLRRIVLLAALLKCLTGVAGVLVPQDSYWRFFKGYSEASTPDATAWRQLGFDDSAWVTSQAAFYYENNPGNPTAYSGNTDLTDMFGGYTCIFMRQTFVVTNVYDLAALQIAALSDDGFIAWINGQEVGRFNMPAGDVPYNGTASPALPEPIPWWTNTVSDLQSFLVPGTNVLAVNAFNCLAERQLRLHHQPRPVLVSRILPARPSR